MWYTLRSPVAVTSTCPTGNSNSPTFLFITHGPNRFSSICEHDTATVKRALSVVQLFLAKHFWVSERREHAQQCIFFETQSFFDRRSNLLCHVYVLNSFCQYLVVFLLTRYRTARVGKSIPNPWFIVIINHLKAVLFHVNNSVVSKISVRR